MKGWNKQTKILKTYVQKHRSDSNHWGTNAGYKNKIISSLKDVQVTQGLAQNSILKIEDVHSYMILNFVKRTIQYQLSRNEARGQLHVSDFKLISIIGEFMDMKLIEISKRFNASYLKNEMQHKKNNIDQNYSIERVKLHLMFLF